jgi:hypothetical protein
LTREQEEHGGYEEENGETEKTKSLGLSATSMKDQPITKRKAQTLRN